MAALDMGTGATSGTGKNLLGARPRRVCPITNDLDAEILALLVAVICTEGNFLIQAAGRRQHR